MRVLAIDTSGSSLGVAVLGEDRVLASRYLDWGYMHAEGLLPAIDGLYRALGMSPADTELVAVSSGPGSFTGLRVGVTTAGVLAQDLGVPLVGVSTFDTLAYQARFHRGEVACLLDARRGAVFAAFYSFCSQRPQPAQIPSLREGPGTRLESWELVEKICERKNVLILGSAVPLLRDEISSGLMRAGVQLSPGEHNCVRPEAVGFMGQALLDTGGQVDPVSLKPEYLRPPGIKRKSPNGQ